MSENLASVVKKLGRSFAMIDDEPFEIMLPYSAGTEIEISLENSLL